MIKYIAFLRGINISGKNKIQMCKLKNELNKLGYKNVSTYLNSGNVIFLSDINDKNIISDNIHLSIFNKFNLDIPVHIITENELEEILNSSPNWWGKDDKTIYDNIIFIIYPSKYKEIYEELGEPKKEYEKIYEYKNNIFWSYNLDNYRKTNWWSKTANSKIKDKITIRTANTVKKILEICKNINNKN